MRYCRLALVVLALAGCNQQTQTPPPQAKISRIEPATIQIDKLASVGVWGENLQTVNSITATNAAITDVAANSRQVKFQLQALDTATPGPIKLTLLNEAGTVVPTDKDVIVTLVGERVQLTDLKDQLTSLSKQIQEFQGQQTEQLKKLASEVQAASRTAEKARAVALEARDQLTKEVAAINRKLTEAQTGLQRRISGLSEEQAKLSRHIGGLEANQKQIFDRVGELSAKTGDLAVYVNKSTLDVNLITQAVEKMGQRKVGGILGIGRKKLLPNKMREKLRAAGQNQIRVQPGRQQ